MAGRRVQYEHKLRALHAVGFTDSEIAVEVGRSRPAVGVIRRRLGLQSNRFHERYRNRASEFAKRRRSGYPPKCALQWKRSCELYARRNGWPEDLRPREVTVLNALLERGPMNRKQICEAVGLRWRGGNKSLKCSHPGGTILAILIRRGFVVSLGKVSGANVYSLALSVEPIPVAERMLV